MSIEHQENPDGTLTVWSYPASGDRYTYNFNAELELTDKFHTTNPATSEESKSRVAPNVTPSVRDYLSEQGFDY